MEHSKQKWAGMSYFVQIDKQYIILFTKKVLLIAPSVGKGMSVLLIPTLCCLIVSVLPAVHVELVLFYKLTHTLTLSKTHFSFHKDIITLYDYLMAPLKKD